jgi:DNA-binding PadR family transcriptional regulator
MMSISKVESRETEEQLDDEVEEIRRPRGGSRLIAGMMDEDSKNISRQLVDLEILYLLNFGPKSGYQLKKNLFNSFHLNLSYGTLYPHLHSLDKAELISGTWKYPNENAPLKKRMYSLTEKGTTKLTRSISSLSKIALTMQFMLTKLDLNPKINVSPEETARLDEALGKVEQFLKSQGFTIHRSAHLKGFSGLEHFVDLQALRVGPDGRTESLVAKVTNSGISIDDVFRVYVMSYDLQTTRAILLCAPTVSEEVMKLAEFYAISIYVGKDLDEARSKMESDFLGR